MSTKFDTIRQAIEHQDFSLGMDKNGTYMQAATTTKLASKSYVNDGGMARSIDSTLDPCDDFYQFVCSGWMKDHPISEYDAVESQMRDLRSDVVFEFISLFEKEELFRNNRERMLILNYFASCTNKNSTKTHRNSLFFNERRKLKQNGNSITDWMINDYPSAYFFDISVLPDDYNSTNNILVLQPFDPIMSLTEYTSAEYRNQYKAFVTYLKKIHTLLANDDRNHEVFANNSTEVTRRVRNILRIDRQIAQISHTFPLPYVTYQNVALDQMASLINQIDYQRYFNTVFPKNIVQRKEFNKTVVQVLSDKAAKAIDDLLRKSNPLAVADYLDYQFINEMILSDALDASAMKIYNDYRSSIDGTRQLEDDKMELYDLITCITSTTEIFPDIASALYIENYFPQQSKDEVEMMVEKLKESFLEMLSEETWIDEKTKEQAREKVSAMRQFVGYNPDIFNQTAISIKYSTLNIPQNLSSWEVDVRVGKWLADNAYQTLFEKNVLGDFEFLASDVNAYYLTSQNTIAVPAGILQSPFFNATQSIAQNYGAIGTLIGHEITHGFDDDGAQYDGDGNLRNWWDKATFSNFKNKTRCFVDEYGSQQVENLTLKVDGNMTLGENIADNGGFRAALRAFQKLLRTNQGGSRPSAPELQKYTPLQIFFMSYAYNWCAISRPSYLLDSVPDDSHSPKRIRVNTVLSNQPEFAQTFNCPDDSKMLSNPKCTLW